MDYMNIPWCPLVLPMHQLSHPSFEKIKPKHLYVCPGCSNHTYSNNMVNRYNISTNYKVKSYKMTRGSKRKIIEWHKNLSVGVSSTGTIGGEAGLVFIFWLLLVLLIGLQHLVRPKATIEASLSRLMVATQQVWKNMTWGLITRKARLGFNL
jgi:tetrahydromethanopterin S-methyltransferase subunit F